MDTLITQVDLKAHDDLGMQGEAVSKQMAALRATPEYVKLEAEAKELSEKRAAIEAKFVEAAKKAKTLGVKSEPVGEKSHRPDLETVTEPGVYRVEVTFGTSDSTAWKPVVEAIKDKNCTYTNGDNKAHPLNMVLPSIIAGKTSTRDTVSVKVKVNE